MPIRRAILEQLTSSVRSMLAQEVPERILFLTGEAGIGKSTLVQQLMSDLEKDAKPPIVAMAECSTPVAGSGIGHVEALKPFADIMAGLVDGAVIGQKKQPGFKLDVGKFFIDTAPAWIGMIPILGSPVFHALSIMSSGYDQVHLHKKLKSQGAGAASNQEQVFRQYINFLSKLSEELPVLIILDDFHWADTSSTNLLFASARDLALSRVVFLVVYREEDIRKSVSSNEHPLLRVRNEIERYSMGRGIDVLPVVEHEIRALIRESYPDYVSDIALEKWLLRITNGNLLFATQFLLKLANELYLEPGTAVVRKDLETVNVPSSAQAVVVEHIRKMSAEDKEHLRYASVEGETITAHMVSRFLDVPMIKMLQRLRVLEEQHNVIRSLGKQALYTKETTAFQFVHYLVHRTLYHDLGEEEKVLLHGVAADVLEEELASAEQAQHNVHVVAARLAAHASIAQRFELAVSANLKAARWVWRSFAAHEALHLLDQCIQGVNTHNDPTASMQNVLLEGMLLKAAVVRHSGRNAESVDLYSEALALTERGIGTAKQICEAHLGISVGKRALARFDDAEADAQTALRIAKETNEDKSQIIALRIIGNTHDSRGNYDEALMYYQQSLDRSIASGNEEDRAMALGNIGSVQDDRGHKDLALEYHREALELHRALNDTVGITRGLLNIGAALHGKRHFEHATESYEEALRLARSTGDRRIEPTILHNMSIISRQQGRFDEAMDLIQRSLAINEQIGDISGVAQSLGEVGTIYVDTHRLDEAMETFKRSMNMANEVKNRFAAAIARFNIAYVHMLQQRLVEAQHEFDTTLKQFVELGVANLQVETAFGAACCAVKESAASGTEVVYVNAVDLFQMTRDRVVPEDFTLAEYERVLNDWIPNLKQLGITVSTS